jgi:hypothetical protein
MDAAARFKPLVDAAVDILEKHTGDENDQKWVRVLLNNRNHRGNDVDTVWTIYTEVSG